MTPERARYFASISTEERIIRARIRFLKDDISDDKHALNTVSLIRKFRKSCIKENKILIKNLKKQLPAPKKMIWSCFEECVCPICEEGVQQEYTNYCPHCGQKLR